MAMMRKNPLPPGRYWIYIQKPSAEVWEGWLKRNADVVTVEKKEEYGGLGPFINPNETFYIFNVKEPTIWPRGVGFANTADPSVKGSEDTVIRPPPMTPADVLRDMEETAAEAGRKVLSAAWDWSQILLIGGAIYLLTRNRR